MEEEGQCLKDNQDNKGQGQPQAQVQPQHQPVDTVVTPSSHSHSHSHSHSSHSHAHGHGHGHGHGHTHAHGHNQTHTGHSSSKEHKQAQPHSHRVAYVSERRGGRKAAAPTLAKEGSRGALRDDSKKTQAALLKLLADFREPAPSTASDQLALIRQQQDDLTRLHFKLGSDPDAPAKPADARETMAKLVHSLEQLSTSIERFHTITDQSGSIPDISTSL